MQTTTTDTVLARDLKPADQIAIGGHIYTVWTVTTTGDVSVIRYVACGVIRKHVTYARRAIRVFAAE